MCLDVTIMFRFIDSFLPCFAAKVLSGKFCEEAKPGTRKFHLKNDFLILVSIKWL